MDFLKAIFKTSLFKLTSLNSFSVALKIGIGLITSKIIAIFVGPSGMTLVGNLRNFVSTLETISTLGFQNGIVKYVAENENKEIELKKIISTIFISITIIALVLSGLLFFLADYWNEIIFGVDFKYNFVFKSFAFTLPWYAGSIILIAIINGLGKFKSVIYCTIIGNLMGLFISVFMIWHYHTLGAMLSIIITPALLFFVALYFLNNELNCFKTIAFDSFDYSILKKMSSYSFMALFAAVIGPLVFLAIRNNAIMMVGLQKTGYWVTIDLISNYYLMFIGTILGVYFLPKLAVAKSNLETKKVLWLYFKNIIPVFILGLIILYILKDIVIHLLFTKAFLPVSKLFFWQLIGDVFKACSLILGYNLVAKKLTFAFISFEIMSLSVMYFTSKILIASYGIEGVVMAHCFTYFIYLSVLTIYFRKSLF